LIVQRSNLMAQHGYLRDYDEGWDRNRDREGDQWRERSDRDWRARDEDWSDPGSDFMFRNRDREPGREDERGFFSRMGDEARSWLGEGDRDDRREERHTFSSHPDDHYRSWRDRQMQSLDRDYRDYCREREQQFHRDFDSWRQNRQQQQRQSGSSTDTMDLTEPVARSSNVQGE
jgi:hypothetical protein